MIAFWTSAAVLLIIALAFIAPVLIRGPRPKDREIGHQAIQARKQLASLDQAHRDGHIEQDAYEARRKAINELLLASLEGEDEPEQTDRSPRIAILIVLVAPLFAWFVYDQVGDPVAIKAAQEGWLKSSSPVAAQPHATGAGGQGANGGSQDGSEAPPISQMIRGLEQRLENNPDDAEGWFLLGRSYMTLGETEQAIGALEKATELAPNQAVVWADLGQAYGRAERWDEARQALETGLDLAPEEVFLKVELARALMFSNPDRVFTERAEALLRESLEAQPDQQMARMLLGMGLLNRGEMQPALDYLEPVLAELEPEAGGYAMIRDAVNRARMELGLPEWEASAAGAQTPAIDGPEQLPESMAERWDDGEDAAPQAAPEPTPNAPDVGGIGLTVEVSLAEELAEQVNPSDIVFIFARAAEGPPMPLAIQRVAAGQLPVSVRLDESMAMMDTMSMATFPQVVVGARISKTGDARPQPGDLQALSEPVDNDSSEPIRIRIDTIL